MESSLAGTAKTQLFALALVSSKPIAPTKPLSASFVAKALKKTLEINIPPGQDSLVKNQLEKFKSTKKSLRI